VWIEPFEWDIEKGPCPIAQLDVDVTNYLDEVEMRGPHAVTAAEAYPCSFAAILF
jgi:hypothetical protein